MQDMPTWRVSRAGGGIGAQVGSESHRTRRARLWGMLSAVEGRHGCESCHTCFRARRGWAQRAAEHAFGACFFLFKGRCGLRQEENERSRYLAHLHRPTRQHVAQAGCLQVDLSPERKLYRVSRRYGSMKLTIWRERDQRIFWWRVIRFLVVNVTVSTNAPTPH